MSYGKQRKSTASHTLVSPSWNSFHALREDLFLPYFQPIITLRTGRLAGFEVLARCDHPTEGIIAPAKFIREAEENGLMDKLTRQVLTKAFAAASCLPEPLTLSINISPVQLRNLDLPQELAALARASGFAPSRLIVEITESALIDNLEEARGILSELKAMGCRLALDDFGTGYSSLRHVQSLPLDELKIDQSFVSSMTTKRLSRKIVSAVVGLGQSLELTTVAEGIETQEQAEMMLWLGCDQGQGYFYGRPMPAADLGEAIRTERTAIVSSASSPWKKISASTLGVSPMQRMAQLQAVYDGAPIALAFIDRRLKYVNLNKRLADLNGASLEDHLGSDVSAMIPELFPKIEGHLRRALKGEVIQDVEAMLPHTGETRLLSYQPALDEAGEVIGVSLAVIDITARKRTEEALRQSEAHYRSMVALNPQVLWIMDPQGRNLDVSPRWDKTTGLLIPQSRDHDWLQSIHPDDVEATVRSISRSRHDGRPINVRYRVANGKESWQWKQSIGSPRFDASGKVVCWYGSIEDIREPEELPQIDIAVNKPLASGIHLAINRKVTSKPEKREQALRELAILDTPAEAEFNDLVLLASELCSTPISLISLLDLERQWFKASVGLNASETPLSSSFCKYAVEQQDVFVVEDAARDPRFERNALVTGDPHIRFYAGAPIYGMNRTAIGTLCVIDTVPRTLSPSQVRMLTILAQQVQARLELRGVRKKLQDALAKTGS